MACRDLQAFHSPPSPASRRLLGRKTQTCPARIQRHHEVGNILPVEDGPADRRSAKTKRKATSDKSLQGEAKRMKGKSPEPHAQLAEEVQAGAASPNSNTAPFCSELPNRTLSRAEFQARYLQTQPLGKGGFGSVFAGFRIADYLPVALKHISREKVICTPKLLNGKLYQFPLEVELLFQAGAGAGPSGSSAAVTLLDWFYMEQQLILVMERPFPSVDLHHYLAAQGGFVDENQAKLLMRQLVDAAIEIHTKGVFHRDLKPRNILMDIRSQLPCVRLIDFGCGSTLHEGFYTEYSGTFYYTPPEWFRFRRCSAGPTTVWQLGVVLFEMLFSHRPFKTESQIIHSHLVFGDEVSQECQHFLSQCLAKSPECRPTLEQLRLHPWLR
ncbi:serine/threonine-protein kinase pim-2-like [Myripristis murdjan]|uniref:serine/threonine-protein kinase pim-2-like n=1 Tax=Myripristis murdjan TaxID=586833 RepID=UPI001175CDEB|nr:serine/threonine-protein kinase pim-2-like [Myripristis murdjan]